MRSRATGCCTSRSTPSAACAPASPCAGPAGIPGPTAAARARSTRSAASRGRSAARRARGEHEHRPHRGRVGRQRDRIARRARDRAARARGVGAPRFARALALLAVEPPLALELEELGSRPAGRSIGVSRCATCAACARSSGCRTSSWRPRRTPTPRSRPASRALHRLCHGRRDAHADEYLEIGSLARAGSSCGGARGPSFSDHPTPDGNGAPARPASAREIEHAVACVRAARELGRRRALRHVELREPARSSLGVGRGGAAPPREAALVVLAGGRTHEAIVALEDRRLVSWSTCPGTHAAITADSTPRPRCEVKADAGFRRAPWSCAASSDSSSSWSTPGRWACSRSGSAASAGRSPGCAAISRATTATRARSAA